jgi:hypothetical protein
MCGAWFALASWAVPSVAHAALHRERVAIVFTEGFDDREGVVRDLASEFRAEGFDVRLIGKELDDAPLEGWAARARNDGDRALIHVVPGGGGDAVIEVLLVKPDNLVFKDTVRRQANDASDIASVRAVEVTRAALIEVHEPPPPPATGWDIVRDDPYAARVRARSPFIAASVSPVLAITGQSPLNMLGLGLNLSWLPSEHVALEVEGTIPLSQGTESAPEGTASVSATFLDVGASIFFASKDQWFRPYLAARAGAAIFSMSAAPAMYYVGSSQTFASFFNTVALGGSIWLGNFVRLRAEASVGVTASPPVLQINTKEVDRLGLPIALLRIGPEVTW